MVARAMACPRTCRTMASSLVRVLDVCLAHPMRVGWGQVGDSGQGDGLPPHVHHRTTRCAVDRLTQGKGLEAEGQTWEGHAARHDRQRSVQSKGKKHVP